MDRSKITEALAQPFDPSLIDQKKSGGGKMLSYVGHEHYRQLVIDATGNEFDWHIERFTFEDDGAAKRYADRETGEVKRPRVMIVHGRLTIPGLGSRDGIGVHPIDEGSGEDTYKAADSDAFKRAALAFGVGLEQLYKSTKPAPRQERSGGNQQSNQRASGGNRPTPQRESSDAGSSNAEGWTGFWRSAKAAGYAGRDAVEAAIGSIDGMTPTQAAEALAAKGAAAA